MKSPIREFFAFSRMERLGFSILAILILLALAFRFWLGYKGSQQPALSDEDRRLAAVYEEWKKKVNTIDLYSEDAHTNPSAELYFFDPNTLDSAGFIRLGIPAKAVRGLLNWRRKGKQFRKADDLATLYNLPAEVFSRIRPYISIMPGEDYVSFKSDPKTRIPETIDINSADSALLDRAVAGIGAVLAYKIVARREALGGFVSMDQLLEVYRFPDSVFKKIKDRLILNPANVQKMELNSVVEARLAAHPYIGMARARNILLYRQGLGQYSDIGQLREVPLMSEEIYRKIAPYFIIK